MRYFIVKYVRRTVKEGLKMREQTDEIISVSKKIKMNDVQTAAVILDFCDRRVCQASLDGKTVPKDWIKIRDFYHQHYADVIDQLEQINGTAPKVEAAQNQVVE